MVEGTADGRDCPLCSYPSVPEGKHDYGERRQVDCRRCGRFVITATAAVIVRNQKKSPLLSAWIREKAERGAEAPVIDSNVFKSLEPSLPRYSVLQKQSLLLAALGRRSKYPGAAVTIVPDVDYPLAWSANEAELGFYLDTLKDRSLIRDHGPRSLRQSEFPYVVTSAGWQTIDEDSRTSPLSDQVFVAMSFSTALLPAYTDALAPAITSCGYRPLRVDSEPHSDRIDVKIMAEIRQSRFVVADVTEQRKGVYFEAGFALGLGIPVIWSVQDDDLKNVHFDTRQYNHVVWRDVEDYRVKLEDFVGAIIGKRQ